MTKYLNYISLFFLLSCNDLYSQNNISALFPIKEFGKWGFINSTGRKVIQCRFDDVKPFSENIAAIKMDSIWGFIDTDGKIIIEPKYYDVEHFSDGLCRVYIKDDSLFQNYFIRKDGSIAFVSKFTRFDLISPFAYGRATVEINEKVNVIDTLGNIIFNTHYPYGGGSPLKEGIVHVWKSNATKYFDKDGKLLLKLKGMGYSNFNNGLALVAIKGNSYFINKKGKVIIKPEFPEFLVFEFSNGLAKISKRANDFEHDVISGFIDTTGKVAIPFQFYNVYDFHEGYAAFLNEDVKWGFINKTGSIAIKPQFESIDYSGFTNGLCLVKNNHQWGYINYDGEFVWKEQIGIEYEPLDLSKWKLDTLKVFKPHNINKYAGYNNYPRKIYDPIINQIILKIDTADITVYLDKYYAYKLYLLNSSIDTIAMKVHSGRINIIQQAKNYKGEWQDVEYFESSFCGNSNYVVKLLPNEFQIYAIPIFEGAFKTQFRFKLNYNNQEIYSNTYEGYINFGQFIKP